LSLVAGEPGSFEPTEAMNDDNALVKANDSPVLLPVASAPDFSGSDGAKKLRSAGKSARRPSTFTSHVSSASSR
jgi:hypothetical protein